ncbi:MAG TPA: hypothetical protein VL334_04850 [Anaerolineae bacterium]|nr:hypothetical protein [Anaerolineae bacterium]
MTATTKATQRVNVTFPVEVLESLEKLLAPRQRNHFIVEATERALQDTQIDRALNALLEEPAWTDENHPDLMSVDDVDRYVRKLRESWMAHAWEESETEAETDG